MREEAHGECERARNASERGGRGVREREGRSDGVRGEERGASEKGSGLESEKGEREPMS